MTHTGHYDKVKKAHNEPVIKQLFDTYAQESISEEQVIRVLEPIVRMIGEGRFDKPKSSALSWMAKPLVLIGVVAVTSVLARLQG